MARQEHYYHWQWELRSSPVALWPYVADTNRFNKDTKLPSVERLYHVRENDNLRQQRLRFHLGNELLQRLFSVVWEEEPFEWAYPYRFGVVRRYREGPVAQVRVRVELEPQPGGSTVLTYETWALAANWLGELAIPLSIGFVSRRRFGEVFARYDQMARQDVSPYQSGQTWPLAMGGRARIEQAWPRLVSSGCEARLVNRLVDLITEADDLTLSRIRPYLFADHWGEPREAVLALFLQATREGLLNFQWEILCPLCRGAEDKVYNHLDEIDSRVHCHSCNIDFDVNFERSVELTFTPTPAIRRVRRHAFCVGGPQMTPHVTVQQIVPPRSERAVTPIMEIGRYRLRAMERPGGQFLRVAADGRSRLRLTVADGAWPSDEKKLAPSPSLVLANETGAPQVMVLERTAWSDQALTAAEVTTLQRFRDLFANEALRPGEQIAVGSLTILFTDLCDSTRMYREIGDATAFGLVMNHFDVLREAIEAEDGAMVKTIGDAVMAVFLQPAAALRAMTAAQHRLGQARRPLHLKAAVHHGPCIAVTLNNQLDYFGSTVNVASRLAGFAVGGDIVVTEVVYQDPEVAEWLAQPTTPFQAETFTRFVQGFDQQYFRLWRLQMAPEAEPEAEPIVRTGLSS